MNINAIISVVTAHVPVMYSFCMLFSVFPLINVRKVGKKSKGFCLDLFG